MSSATFASGTASVTLDPSQQKESIGKAIGRIPSGVYIVTLSDKGERHGMMATWVAQAAFEPPTISLSLNKQRQFLTQVVPGAQLTLNVLSANNMNIFKSFAAPAKDGVDRFEGLSLVESKQASGPVFAEAVAYMDLKVTSLVEAGDHVVALAEVVGGGLLNEEAQPLVHLRKNGFGY